MMTRPKLFAGLLLATLLFIWLSFFLLTTSDSGDDHQVDTSSGQFKTTGSDWLKTQLSSRGLVGDEFEADDGILDEKMARRRLSVDRLCRHLWLQRRTWKHESSDFDHVIVDDRHRLLYCSVAKVASTNWKRLLMVLQGNWTHDPMSIPANESHRANVFRTLDSYSEAEVDYRLRHYFKFLFVRHPFERLLSAYRNKFEKDNAYFHTRFGRRIVERYRSNASEAERTSGANVTFPEFANYLVDPVTRTEGPLNEHWRPIADLCHPCAIRYDVIGKYDGLSGEAPYVLRRAGIGHLVTFPRLNHTGDTATLLAAYFQKLKPAVIFKLYQMYTLDFKMFSYSYPDFDTGLRE